VSDTDNNPSIPTKPVIISRPVTLRWLLALALLYTLYFAKTLLMPMVVALLFALLLSPLVSILKRFYVPPTLSAILLLTVIVVPFTLLGIGLAEPVQKWMKKLPELSAQMTESLDSITDAVSSDPYGNVPVEPQKGIFQKLFGGDEPVEEIPPKKDNAISERVMQGGIELIVSILGATPIVVAQFLAFMILVLFLLIFGPRLYSSSIKIFPRVKDKQRATLLVENVQRELSRYILTVSIINTGLGLVTGTVLWLLGVEDALLWGALVGLLNFAPYIGPMIGICILAVAGAVQYGLGLEALLPSAVYFCINLLEAQFITPMVLGHHMRLNPLVLIVWLMIWGWLWGAAGVLLAVPLLVCLKLAAQQLNILSYWVTLIETRA